MTEKYADKIAALLRKAESTDSPEEAEAFSRKAEALMVKWGISDAMIQASSATAAADPIVEKTYIFTGIYESALRRYFGPAIVRGFGTCKVLLGGRKGWMYIIGHESDVKRVIDMLTSLERQAMAAVKIWWATEPNAKFVSKMDGFKARRQFLISFGVAVGDRIELTFREQVSETTGSELVLVDRKTKVENWMQQQYGVLTSSRSNMSASHLGRTAGRDAGRSAVLGNEMSGGRVALNR